ELRWNAVVRQQPTVGSIPTATATWQEGHVHGFGTGPSCHETDGGMWEERELATKERAPAAESHRYRPARKARESATDVVSGDRRRRRRDHPVDAVASSERLIAFNSRATAVGRML